MKNPFRNDVFIGAALAAAAFTVYLSTLAPGIGWEDTGELATVAATLGIAHPTGYPLFTILGYAFSHLPLGGRVIWKLNLLSALLCSAAIYFYYRLFLILLSEKAYTGFGPRRSSEAAGKKTKRIASKDAAVSPDGNTANRLAATAGVLILAFSETYWSMALSIEVYPLHLLLLALVMLLFVSAVLEHATGKTGKNSLRSWYAFALVLGLSFTNHVTTGLLAPAFLYLYFSTHGFGRPAWMKIGKAVFPFLAGLSLYLYIPWRAWHAPIMNWGDPAAWKSFWWHISAQQYQSVMFSSSTVAVNQLKYFFTEFPYEFGYLPALLALPGLAYLFRRAGKMLVFSVLLFFGCLVFSVNYDFNDVSFFLIAYVAAAIWIVYGIRACLGYAQARRLRPFAQALCAGLVLLPLCLHYRSVDESRNYAVEDYARNFLGFVDPGAIILSNEYRELTVPAYYLQLIEGVRPDVVILDQNLLCHPWYYAQLENRYPWLFGNSRSEIAEVVRELDVLAHTTLDEASTAVFAAKIKEGMRSLILENYRTHPIYITTEIKPEMTVGFHRIANGLGFRLFHETPAVPVPPREFTFRPLRNQRNYTEAIRAYYAAGYLNQGIYGVVDVGDTATGIYFLRKSLEVKPDFKSASDWLKRLGVGR